MSSLLNLYMSFFKIGIFSFGGGLSSLPLIQEEIVGTNGWLSLSEFSDLVSIAQMTPGPISLNAATFVGTNLHGLKGAIVASIGNISPSIIIVSFLAAMYFKYQNLSTFQGILDTLKPASLALIAAAGLNILSPALLGGEAGEILSTKINYLGLFLFGASLFILQKKKVHPILTMLSVGIVYTLAKSVLPF